MICRCVNSGHGLRGVVREKKKKKKKLVNKKKTKIIYNIYIYIYIYICIYIYIYIYIKSVVVVDSAVQFCTGYDLARLYLSLSW